MNRGGVVGRLILAGLLLITVSNTASAAGLEITEIRHPETVAAEDTVRVTVTVANTGDTDADRVMVRAAAFDRVKEQDIDHLSGGGTDAVTFSFHVPEDADGTEDIQIRAEGFVDTELRWVGTGASTLEVTGGVTVTPDSDLEITEIVMPARIRPGDEARITVGVTNTGDGDPIRSVDVAVTAFGRTAKQSDVSIDAGETVTVPLTVQVPDTATSDTATVSATTAGEEAVERIRLPIAPVFLTMQLTPQTVSVGDPVRVEGMMSDAGIAGDLFVAGQLIGTVRSDQTNHYSHTFVPEQTGTLRVEVVAAGGSAERFLRVQPRVDITRVSVPQRANRDTPFDVCVTVAQSTTDPVTLTVSIDDVVVQSTLPVTAETDRCVTTRLSSTGNHSVTVTATARDVTDTATHQVQVVPATVSVDVFPRQLTLLRGEAGIVQVTVTNDRAAAEQFTVQVTGDLAEIVTGERTITVPGGGERTVYLRVVPDTIRPYNGTVIVSSDPAAYGAEVLVQTTENPVLKQLPFPDARERLNEWVTTAYHQRYTIAAVVIVAVVGLFLYLRRRTSPLEPRHS